MRPSLRNPVRQLIEWFMEGRVVVRPNPAGDPILPAKEAARDRLPSRLSAPRSSRADKFASLFATPCHEDATGHYGSGSVQEVSSGVRRCRCSSTTTLRFRRHPGACPARLASRSGSSWSPSCRRPRPCADRGQLRWRSLGGGWKPCCATVAGSPVRTSTCHGLKTQLTIRHLPRRGWPAKIQSRALAVGSGLVAFAGRYQLRG